MSVKKDLKRLKTKFDKSESGVERSPVNNKNIIPITMYLSYFITAK